jgi:probable addiction module antidote protein
MALRFRSWGGHFGQQIMPARQFRTRRQALRPRYPQLFRPLTSPRPPGCQDALERALTHALGIVARSRGMTDLAERTGLTRQALYKALSVDGNPEFGTILKVMRAMGFRLAPVAA